jgi:hypothetical protein
MNHLIKNWIILPAAALALLLAPASSRATIVFTQSSVQTDINIGAYTEGQNNTTAFGQELGNGPNLLQAVTNTPLTIPSTGQARIAAASSSNLFTTVTFTPSGSATAFSVFELNPQILTPGGSTGFFRLTALDQNGTTFTSAVFTLGNGDNRTAAVGQNGEVITSLTIASFSNSQGTVPAALIADVRQVRVTTGVAPIAEPATLASAVSVLASCGAFGVYRRFRKPAAV